MKKTGLITLRVLTCNVWTGLNYRGILAMGNHAEDRRRRYQALITGIRELSPDIIALQEVNPLPQYAREIAADLGYEQVYQVSIAGIRIGRFGIPINLRQGEMLLVRKPSAISHKQTRRLSGRGIVGNIICLHLYETRQAMLAVVDTGGPPLNLYITHLHSCPHYGPACEESVQKLKREYPDDVASKAISAAEAGIKRRRTEISRLAEFARQTLPQDRPALMLGDLNTSPESGDMNALLSDGEWLDTFRECNPEEPGHTWDPAHNHNFRLDTGALTAYGALCNYHDSHSHRFDYILANSNISRENILESRVVLNDHANLPPSDHYGVLTTLRL